MTVEEVLSKLESQGWRPLVANETCRQLRHETLPGVITLAGRLNVQLPDRVLQSVWRSAGIGETR